MAKEKKTSNGKGLKIFAILLLIISFGCIGFGVYALLNTTPVEDKAGEVDESTEGTVEELDVKSDEVINLYTQLAFNEISVYGVDDSVKDFYYTKKEINDDLKLFLSLITNEKVKNYKDGESVVVPTSELEETITSMFETARSDDYKNMYLGQGLQATYDANAKNYTISSIGDIKDDSKYYGEVTSATKEDSSIKLTITTYYASLEQGEDNKAVYKLFKDSTKKDTLSEESYEALPEISKVTSDKMDSYIFVFSAIDDGYKFTSFEKVVKE